MSSGPGDRLSNRSVNLVATDPCVISQRVRLVPMTPGIFAAGLCSRQADSTNSSTRGKMYLFHNTALQPPSWASNDVWSGPEAGLLLTSSKNHLQDVTTRSNILQVGKRDSGSSIFVARPHASNSFDYDLYNGQVQSTAGAFEFDSTRICSTMPTTARGSSGWIQRLRGWIRASQFRTSTMSSSVWHRTSEPSSAARQRCGMAWRRDVARRSPPRSTGPPA